MVNQDPHTSPLHAVISLLTVVSRPVKLDQADLSACVGARRQAESAVHHTSRHWGKPRTRVAAPLNEVWPRVSEFIGERATAHNAYVGVVLAPASRITHRQSGEDVDSRRRPASHNEQIYTPRGSNGNRQRTGCQLLYGYGASCDAGHCYHSTAADLLRSSHCTRRVYTSSKCR